MTWFNNLRLRDKFLTVALLILTFLLLMGGVGTWGIFTVNELLQHTQSQQVPGIYQLAASDEKIQLVRNLARQVLAEPDSTKIASLVEQTDKDLATARQHWDIYSPLPHLKEEETLVRRFEEVWKEWKVEIGQVLTLAQQDSPGSSFQALQILNQGKGQELTSILSDLMTINYQGAARQASTAHDTFVTVVILQAVIILLIIALTVGAMLVLARSINSPIKRLQMAMQALAAGDLTRHVKIPNKSELGELSITYNSTLSSLQNLIKQLYTQSQQVSLASAELSSQATNQVADSSLQARVISEITKTIHELNQTAEEITRQTLRTGEAVELSLSRAETVNHLADKMTQTQGQGRQTIAHSIEALQDLKGQIETINNQQQILIQQSAVIHQVIELLEGLARETHLLALNAAIEAAGAGLHGERFAVVAGEVKQLAGRSMQATNHVRKALIGIAETVDTTGRQVVEALQRAEQAVHEAAEADRVLIEISRMSDQVKQAAGEIVVQVKGTAELASGIGIATKQQQVSSHEMLEKMLEVEAVTSQNLFRIKQGEVATYQISLSARQLEKSADSFKLVNSELAV